VILSEETMDQIAHGRAGDLAAVPFSALLYALARSERTVTLSMTRRSLVKEIVVEGGVPVHCRSNLAHETLNRFMQANGLLDETTANDCFSESCSRGVRFGDVLIDRGLITAEELRKVLQKNLARKLLDCFSWLQGSFTLSESTPGVDSSLKVNVPQLILLGVTRFATQHQVDSSIGPLIGKELALHPLPFFALDEIRMIERQRSITDALAAGPARIDELAEATGIGFQELTRDLYAMTLIGIVVTAEALIEKEPPERTAPPSRPATVPARETALPEPVDDDERRTELMEMVLNFRRKDAFELLGVDPGGFGREAQDRLIEFAEKFAPWTYPEDLEGDARRVFLAGIRAFGELTDPVRRQALLESRRSAARGGAGPANAFRTETDLLDPEVQFRQGRALIAEGNYREALEQLSYASDLDPQNGDYRAELAYCRYLYNPQAGGPAAVAELEKALRIDPSSGLANFYQGEVLSGMGLVDEAVRAYRRAVKPMAPDRRPVEALRRVTRGN
jgi:hypothetical protein